ncbi:MAG: neutral/alkaline non-lysosomal ceramidase N-terminal domain-containing protein [Blastocatellia bacterium]
MTALSPRYYLLAMLLCALSLSLNAQAHFQVGTARRDITPTEALPMWGYGDRHDALSQGTLDPLYAAALVVQAGANKLAIVGLDLGRSPNEASLQRIRQRIKTEAGIEYSFIAGSHTHHGPVLELSNEDGKGKGRFDAALRYYQQLEDRIVAAIVEANSKLVPAKLANGVFKLDGFNRNRHTKFEPKPVDQDVSLLRFDDAAGKPLAVLVNYTAHPTSIPSSVLKYSADYVGAMKAAIEKETGARAIFMQGASGDQSTNRGDKDHQAYGQALAQDVLKYMARMKAKEVTAPSLAVREDRFKFGSRTDFANPLIKQAFAKAFFPELIPNFIDEYADGVRPRLTVALLNNEIAFVGASGEFFANHAIRLKERVRGAQVFFFGYANGYHQYFPTIEAVSEGGYGADNTVSPVEVGAGEKLMNTALVWIYQMLGKIK